MRKVQTCFGVFVIEGDVATFIGDDNFYYSLPSCDMADEEIQEFFEELKSFEE